MKHLKWFLILSLVIAQNSDASPKKPKDISPTIGLKNYRELFGALSAATRVDPTLPEIAGYYQQVMAQLPRTGNVVEFNSQSLIASIGLASVFCKRVIYQDAELNVPKSGLNQGIEFMRPASKVTDAKLLNLIKNYSNAFLQRDATVGEQTTLANLFKAQGATDSTAQGTRTAVLAVCTGIAGSFEFLSN